MNHNMKSQFTNIMYDLQPNAAIYTDKGTFHCNVHALDVIL